MMPDSIRLPTVTPSFILFYFLSLILSQSIRLYRFFRSSWAAHGRVLRLGQEPDILQEPLMGRVDADEFPAGLVVPDLLRPVKD